MTQNSSFNQPNLLNIIEENDKQECKTTNEINKTCRGEEVDCNLQTPLMFSRCSSLDSLSGFEQHSIQDDLNSVTSEFSPKTSRPTSPPTFSQNHKSEIPYKLYTSHKINNSQEKVLCDSTFIEKNINPCERISIYTNVSFQYDVAFKKPHFLKHSVFEDDIAAFKDESSPNLLSTAASSLSSLTIEDDDYNDNSLSNKAELVKKRTNSVNILKNTHYQEYSQHGPIGNACESEQTDKANIKKVINQLNHKSMIHRDVKSCAQRNFNKDAFIYKEPKITWNLKNHQYSSNLQDMSLKQNRSDSLKNESQFQVSKKDNFINTLQNNEESLMYHKIQPKEHNDKHNKDDTYEKYRNEKLEFKEKRKVFEDCYKSNKELSNYIEENNDLNAYEEQLLDQCIRRGMAKVTKQKIIDIKPFCWDLNHICLTTRAMLKIHDEEIIRDRKDERSKRQISHTLFTN